MTRLIVVRRTQFLRSGEQQGTRVPSRALLYLDEFPQLEVQILAQRIVKKPAKAGFALRGINLWQ
jgi:hypothetical protein